MNVIAQEMSETVCRKISFCFPLSFSVIRIWEMVRLERGALVPSPPTRINGANHLKYRSFTKRENPGENGTDAPGSHAGKVHDIRRNQ